MIDMQFHCYLASLTKNKRLIQILENLTENFTRMGITAIRNIERCRETLEEHFNIIDALKKNNFYKAKQAMVFHILQTKRNVCKNIEKKENPTDFFKNI